MHLDQFTFEHNAPEGKRLIQSHATRLEGSVFTLQFGEGEDSILQKFQMTKVVLVEADPINERHRFPNPKPQHLSIECTPWEDVGKGRKKKEAA